MSKAYKQLEKCQKVEHFTTFKKDHHMYYVKISGLCNYFYPNYSKTIKNENYKPVIAVNFFGFSMFIPNC